MHLTCTNMPVEKLREALTKVRAGERRAGGRAARRGRSAAGRAKAYARPVPASPNWLWHWSANMNACARQQAKEAGIKNSRALRGDPPAGQETFTQIEGGFACALDLVRGRGGRGQGRRAAVECTRGIHARLGGRCRPLRPTPLCRSVGGHSGSSSVYLGS